jgi:hypothetical protein
LAQKDSESQVASTENQPVEETPAAPETDQAQNPEQSDDAESPPESQQQPDYEGRIKALEAQYQRAEERNRYLEQTARLHEEALRKQQQPQRTSDPDLAPELLELDKTLDPLLQRRLKPIQEQYTEQISRMYDSQDAANFEMYLMRNNPEVFEEDGGLDRVFQEVESVRQRAAQQYNQWLSRADAYMYAQGIRGVQSQAKTRKDKKSVQVREEAKRMQTTRAATSGTTQVAPRKQPDSEINGIREKANRGERLSDSERQKYRDFVAGVSF